MAEISARAPFQSRSTRCVRPSTLTFFDMSKGCLLFSPSVFLFSAYSLLSEIRKNQRSKRRRRQRAAANREQREALQNSGHIVRSLLQTPRPAARVNSFNLKKRHTNPVSAFFCNISCVGTGGEGDDKIGLYAVPT